MRHLFRIGGFLSFIGMRFLNAFVDLDEWMRIFATENIVCGFDSYGHDIGKNMYA